MNKILRPALCRICGSSLNNDGMYLVNGFKSGDVYESVRCNVCDTLQVNAPEASETVNLYESIYKNIDFISGYKRYGYYSKIIANKLLQKTFKLEYSEEIYYSIINILKEKRLEKGVSLNVLEIGSGQGYTTQTLRQLGDYVTGSDISKEACDSACLRFGGEFIVGDVGVLRDRFGKKFDVVLASEVIEHIENPVEFLALCTGLICPGGVILMTTPNYCHGQMWSTTEPPIHLSYFSSNSINFLSKATNTECAFYVNDSKALNSNTIHPLPGAVLNSNLVPNPHYFDNGYLSNFQKLKILLKNLLNRIRFKSLKFIKINDYKDYRIQNQRTLIFTLGLKSDI